MTRAELRHTKREFAIGPHALAKDLDMAGAAHWLQGEEFVFILHLGDEHMLAVVFPVPGLLPQRAIQQLRGLDLAVAGGVQAAAHVRLDRQVELPAVGVPEDRADRFLLDMEQVHFLADLAVVAAFGLLQLVQVGVELLLVAPGGAIDTDSMALR